MKIKYTTLAKQNLLDIKNYIKQDNLTIANKFLQKMKKSIENITIFPYKYRKSYYYDNENIRDMVFKSYTIIYRVNEEKDMIEILEIFNQNLPVIKEYNEDN